jgi:hypothetical protein
MLFNVGMMLIAMTALQAHLPTRIHASHSMLQDLHAEMRPIYHGTFCMAIFSGPL